jgi:2-Cys peroxiredoxin 5
MVKVGDSIPKVELTEGNPGGKVNLREELAEGKGLIIGVPAAFSKFVYPHRSPWDP